MNIIKKYTLSNGLIIDVFDKTFCYFGEYFTVVLDFFSEIAVKEEYFGNSLEFDTASKLLGKKQNYIRTIKREGVYQTEIDKIKSELIHYFEEHSLDYLKKESFAKKFILKRFKEEQRKSEIKKLRSKLVE